jgi:hypothetical protein
MRDGGVFLFNVGEIIEIEGVFFPPTFVHELFVHLFALS